MLGLVGLAAIGVDVPVLRQIVGFIFLSLVPGILILRILKVHNISAVESLVYSVGLSLAFVMFTAVLMNLIFPLFGILRPISTFPLTATLTASAIVLAGVAYKRDKEFLAPSQPVLPALFSPPFLFAFLLLLLGILGALLVNYQQNNVLLLIFIPAVAGTVGLVAFNRFIPERAYSLIIVVIAIALLYHTTTTLASSFVTGYDNQAEHLYQNFVVQSGYWNSAIGGNLNTALSVVMLGPIYSAILNVDLVWITKIIYGLFFCLVPLTLFHIYREQIGSKRAFFSAFFFVSMVIFFGGVGIRQQVGELFLVLLILLMVERRLSPLQKSALAMIFLMALPVSHYALGYINFAFFGLGWLVLILMRSELVAHWWRNLTRRFSRSLANPEILALTPQVHSILNGTLVCLCVVFTLAWFMYTASGTAIATGAYVLKDLMSHISEFFEPLARESLVGTAIGADFTSVSTLGQGFRILQYITQIFIIIGFIRMLFRPRSLKFRAEYVAVTMVSALILFACIAIPYFSGYLEVDRFYHISLLLLSPLCVLGGEAIWQGLSRLFKATSLRLKFKGELASPVNPSITSPIYLRFLALGVLIPYFLFNAGFMFEVTKSELYNVVDTPASEALSSYRVDMKVCNYREHAAMEWLSDVADDKYMIIADDYASLFLSSVFYGEVVSSILYNVKEIPENAYIFLRTWNIEKNEMPDKLIRGQQIRFEHISFDAIPGLSELINSASLIYNNGGAQVLTP